MTDEQGILPTRLVGDATSPRPGSPPGPQPAPPPPTWDAPLRFTGSGTEYFRIWVVNTLLSVLTLGIYSAWAKVRKTRYFWNNTQLDGFAFQYHGNPAAILRGRLLALGLLGAYSLSGHLSRATGLAILAVLGLLAPWLFFKAQRFKLSNTSWRGLRFAFCSTTGEAYRTILPGVLLWLAVAAGGWYVLTAPRLFALTNLALVVALPWLHARLKRYQHGAASFGSQAFAFDPATGAFYGLYLKAFLIAFAILVVGSLGVFLPLAAIGHLPARHATWPMLVAGYSMVLFVYLVAGPYFAARAQQIVWPRTHGGSIRFSTRIAAWPLFKVVLRNVALTVLTLGLYWPLAAVNLARYRIECVTLHTTAPLGTIAAAAQARESSAAGEGAVDLFGLDIGL